MAYVSARYAPPVIDPMMPEPKPGALRVIATDDQGAEWHLREDSRVGDWLRFLQDGGTIEPYVAKEPPE